MGRPADSAIGDCRAPSMAACNHRTLVRLGIILGGADASAAGLLGVQQIALPVVQVVGVVGETGMNNFLFLSGGRGSSRCSESQQRRPLAQVLELELELVLVLNGARFS